MTDAAEKTPQPTRTQPERSATMDSLFILWWVGTTTLTATLLVNLPGALASIAAPRRFTAMILITTLCITIVYALGKMFDRWSDGKFSDGYPPFHAPVGVVIWFLAFVAGCFILPLETWRQDGPVMERILFTGLWIGGWFVCNGLGFVWLRRLTTARPK